MQPTRPLRLPLTIGLASLQCLATGFLLIPFGVAISAAAALITYWAEDINEWIAGIFIAGLSVIGFGLTKLARAWRYRPSDMVFGDAGVRVDGGRRAGLSIAWAEVDEKMSNVNQVFDEEGKDPRWILVVRNTEIAEPDDDVEAESFREIARAIAARVREEEPAARPCPCRATF